MGNCLPSISGFRRAAAERDPATATHDQGAASVQRGTLGGPRTPAQRTASPLLERRPPRRQLPVAASAGIAAPLEQPLSPLTDDERNNPTVRAGARRWLASTAARPMIGSGQFAPIKERFDPALAAAQKPVRERLSSSDAIEKLCDHNFDLLNKQLGRLSPQEKVFLKAFEEAPWHLTHATKYEPLSEELHLKSQAKLTATDPSSGVKINAIDVGQLGNHHYVYFALEAGDTLQKQSSRFGDHLYRLPLKDSGIEEHGLLVLHDFLQPETTAHKHYKDPSSADDSTTVQQWGGVLDFWKKSGLKDTGTHIPPVAGDAPPAQSRIPSTDVPDRCFFRGSQAVQALGRSVLVSARLLKADVRSQVLSTNAENMNTAANGIFRPQIMMPNEFVTSRAERHAIRFKGPLDL